MVEQGPEQAPLNPKLRKLVDSLRERHKKLSTQHASAEQELKSVAENLQKAVKNSTHEKGVIAALQQRLETLRQRQQDMQRLLQTADKELQQVEQGGAQAQKHVTNANRALLEARVQSLHLEQHSRQLNQEIQQSYELVNPADMQKSIQDAFRLSGLEYQTKNAKGEMEWKRVTPILLDKKWQPGGQLNASEAARFAQGFSIMMRHPRAVEEGPDWDQGTTYHVTKIFTDRLSVLRGLEERNEQQAEELVLLGTVEMYMAQHMMMQALVHNFLTVSERYTKHVEGQSPLIPAEYRNGYLGRRSLQMVNFFKGALPRFQLLRQVHYYGMSLHVLNWQISHEENPKRKAALLKQWNALRKNLEALVAAAQKQLSAKLEITGPNGEPRTYAGISLSLDPFSVPPGSSPEGTRLKWLQGVTKGMEPVLKQLQDMETGIREIFTQTYHYEIRLSGIPPRQAVMNPHIPHAMYFQALHQYGSALGTAIAEGVKSKDPKRIKELAANYESLTKTDKTISNLIGEYTSETLMLQQRLMVLYATRGALVPEGLSAEYLQERYDEAAEHLTTLSKQLTALRGQLDIARKGGVHGNDAIAALEKMIGTLQKRRDALEQELKKIQAEITKVEQEEKSEKAAKAGSNRHALHKQIRNAEVEGRHLTGNAGQLEQWFKNPNGTPLKSLSERLAKRPQWVPPKLDKAQQALYKELPLAAMGFDVMFFQQQDIVKQYIDILLTEVTYMQAGIPWFEVMLDQLDQWAGRLDLLAGQGLPLVMQHGPTALLGGWWWVPSVRKAVGDAGGDRLKIAAALRIQAMRIRGAREVLSKSKARFEEQIKKRRAEMLKHLTALSMASGRLHGAESIDERKKAIAEIMKIRQDLHKSYAELIDTQMKFRKQMSDTLYSAGIEWRAWAASQQINIGSELGWGAGIMATMYALDVGLERMLGRYTFQLGRSRWNLLRRPFTAQARPWIALWRAWRNWRTGGQAYPRPTGPSTGPRPTGTGNNLAPASWTRQNLTQTGQAARASRWRWLTGLFRWNRAQPALAAARPQPPRARPNLRPVGRGGLRMRLAGWGFGGALLALEAYLAYRWVAPIQRDVNQMAERFKKAQEAKRQFAGRNGRSAEEERLLAVMHYMAHMSGAPAQGKAQAIEALPQLARWANGSIGGGPLGAGIPVEGANVPRGLRMSSQLPGAPKGTSAFSQLYDMIGQRLELESVRTDLDRMQLLLSSEQTLPSLINLPDGLPPMTENMRLVETWRQSLQQEITHFEKERKALMADITALSKTYGSMFPLHNAVLPGAKGTVVWNMGMGKNNPTEAAFRRGLEVIFTDKGSKEMMQAQRRLLPITGLPNLKDRGALIQRMQKAGTRKARETILQDAMQAAQTPDELKTLLLADLRNCKTAEAERQLLARLIMGRMNILTGYVQELHNEIDQYYQLQPLQLTDKQRKTHLESIDKANTQDDIIKAFRDALIAGNLAMHLRESTWDTFLKRGSLERRRQYAREIVQLTAARFDAEQTALHDFSAQGMKRGHAAPAAHTPPLENLLLGKSEHRPLIFTSQELEPSPQMFRLLQGMMGVIAQRLTGPYSLKNASIIHLAPADGNPAASITIVYHRESGPESVSMTLRPPTATQEQMVGRPIMYPGMPPSLQGVHNLRAGSLAYPTASADAQQAAVSFAPVNLKAAKAPHLVMTQTLEEGEEGLRFAIARDGRLQRHHISNARELIIHSQDDEATRLRKALLYRYLTTAPSHSAAPEQHTQTLERLLTICEFTDSPADQPELLEGLLPIYTRSLHLDVFLQRLGQEVTRRNGTLSSQDVQSILHQFIQWEQEEVFTAVPTDQESSINISEYNLQIAPANNGEAGAVRIHLEGAPSHLPVTITAYQATPSKDGTWTRTAQEGAGDAITVTPSAGAVISLNVSMGKNVLVENLPLDLKIPGGKQTAERNKLRQTVLEQSTRNGLAALVKATSTASIAELTQMCNDINSTLPQLSTAVGEAFRLRTNAGAKSFTELPSIPNLCDACEYMTLPGGHGVIIHELRPDGGGSRLVVQSAPNMAGLVMEAVSQIHLQGGNLNYIRDRLRTRTNPLLLMLAQLDSPWSPKAREWTVPGHQEARLIYAGGLLSLTTTKEVKQDRARLNELGKKMKTNAAGAAKKRKIAEQ